MFQSATSKAVLLLLGIATVSGCATSQGSWLSVMGQNTREGYEKFIKRYPNSAEAEEARRRIEDPGYAFLATCRMVGDEKRAFEGFLASHPSSDYAPTARAYLEFMQETKNYDLDSYKQFATRHPSHPFAPLAKVSLPVLWLKETGRKAGLVVKVGGLIHRGILGGGYGDAQKIHRETSDALVQELEKEGVEVVLLDAPAPDRISEEGIGAIILAHYFESKPPPSRQPIIGMPYQSLLANVLYWDAAESLSNLIYVSPARNLSITVKEPVGDVEYFMDFASLSSPTGKVNTPAALKSIGSYPSPAWALAALQQSDLIKPHERKNDAELLRQLKYAGANPAVADREKAMGQAVADAGGSSVSASAE